MRVLIVDDDRDIRELLAAVVASDGHVAQTAVDGVDALEQLRRGATPGLILLDMMMPRLDGEQFLKALRSDAKTEAIPVVILTGHAMGRQKAAELGVECLMKPVEIDDLERALTRVALRTPG